MTAEVYLELGKLGKAKRAAAVALGPSGRGRRRPRQEGRSGHQNAETSRNNQTSQTRPRRRRRLCLASASDVRLGLESSAKPAFRYLDIPAGSSQRSQDKSVGPESAGPTGQHFDHGPRLTVRLGRDEVDNRPAASESKDIGATQPFGVDAGILPMGDLNEVVQPPRQPSAFVRARRPAIRPVPPPKWSPTGPGRAGEGPDRGAPRQTAGAGI